jgi:uncharacterized membrane protein
MHDARLLGQSRSAGEARTTADDARVARHLRFESRFLLLAVPALAVLLVLHLANVALTDAIRVVILLEGLSLTFWAGREENRR